MIWLISGSERKIYEEKSSPLVEKVHDTLTKNYDKKEKPEILEEVVDFLAHYKDFLKTVLAHDPAQGGVKKM